MVRSTRQRIALLVMTAASLFVRPLSAGEPPVIRPFGQAPSAREDAVPGYLELSDGTVHAGRIYLTRDKRFAIYDEPLKRQREIPLRAVRQIECTAKKEWIEREWKFKELTSSEKMYTGRSYPAREYEHTITLHDGRTITGGLSAVVYVQPHDYTPTEPGKYRTPPETERFILHKRHKGKIGEDLKSLRYVKRIKLGEDALREGREKATEKRAK